MSENWTPGGHHTGGLTLWQLLLGTILTIGMVALAAAAFFLGIPNVLQSIEIARSYWGV